MLFERWTYFFQLAFKHLPRQRRLDDDTRDDVTRMFAMKANKKLIQQYVRETSGTIVTLKDLHNADLKGKTAAGSDINTLVNELQRDSSATIDLVVDENNCMKAVSYRDVNMITNQQNYPEILLLDATYKLNDLRMPLYVLMCIDGNGESPVAALWIAANEERATISALMDIFLKQADGDHVRVIMADKDMVERDVMTEKLPHAALQICLFHVLRTFRREITCEKLGINAGQRQCVLDILQRMAYAVTADDYDVLYQQLKDLGITSVNTYFDANWHSIKEQWVEGLKRQHCNLLTSTNNRVEGFNQKLKSVITRHSGLASFVRDMKTVLAVAETERTHRALQIVQKRPLLRLQDQAAMSYSDLVTPYALKHLGMQLSEAKKRGHVPDATTAVSCECGFFTAMALPCRHMFRFRTNNGMQLFDEGVVARRWRKDYFLRCCPAFIETPDVAAPVSQLAVTTMAQTTPRPMTQNRKFNEAFRITQRLASLTSEQTGQQYKERLEVLRQLETLWSEGKRVVLAELCTSSVAANSVPVLSNIQVCYLTSKCSVCRCLLPTFCCNTVLYRFVLYDCCKLMCFSGYSELYY